MSIDANFPDGAQSGGCGVRDHDKKRFFVLQPDQLGVVSVVSIRAGDAVTLLRMSVGVCWADLWRRAEVS